MGDLNIAKNDQKAQNEDFDDEKSNKQERKLRQEATQYNMEIKTMATKLNRFSSKV